MNGKVDKTGKNIYKAEHTVGRYQVTHQEIEKELERVKKQIRIRNDIVTVICLALILLIIIKNIF